MAATMIVNLPDFPEMLLNRNWERNRTGSPKLNTAAYSLRSTLAAMTCIHLNTTAPKKGPDVHRTCLIKYGELIAAMKVRYPDAAVIKYLDYSSLQQLKKLDGKQIYRMGLAVRTKVVNEFLPLWKSCLGPSGMSPSGRTFEWVMKRVLIMLYRRSKKNNDALPANAGIIIII